jgi:hypothetical protein
VPEQNKQPLSLAQLRERYIQLEIEAARIDREYRNISYDRSQLLLQRDDLEKRLREFERYDRQIQNLRQDRSSISPLAMGKRMDHEEEIMRSRTARKKAEKELKDDHGIAPEEIPERWREFDRQAAELQARIQQLPDIDPIREQQGELGREYQVVWKREPEEQEGQAKLAHEKTEKTDQGKSFTDRMAVVRAESELRKLTDPERGRERDQERKRER